MKAPLRRITDEPARRRLRKGMYLLPSLLTSVNIAAGYFAISQTLQGSTLAPQHFNYAAIAIGFAAVFDFMDGLIARMTGTASEFGKELDSLADVITFGVAPGMLAWVWGVRFVADVESSELLRRLIALGGVASFLYLVACASRLARFNIQLNPQPSNPGRPGRKYFVGMPTPAAAGVIAATVHFNSGSPITTWWTSGLFLALLMAVGFLMVSTWRYYSLKNVDFRSRQSFRWILVMGLVIAAVWLFSEYTLFFLALTYMLSGVILRLFYIFRRPAAVKQAVPEAQAQ